MPCAVCDRAFTPRTRTQRYCSAQCRDRRPRSAPMAKAKCDECGISFIAPARHRQTYCSKGCAGKTRAKQGKVVTPPPPPRVAREQRQCPCGTTFTAPATASKRYCSQPCAGLAKAEPLTTCGCGTEWNRTQHERKYGLTQCKPCRTAERRMQRVPKASRWKGVKPYVRANLSQRTAGRCEDCGALEGAEPHHIHHVVPRALGGTHALDNLRLLCPDCHMGSGFERNHWALLMSGKVAHRAA